MLVTAVPFKIDSKKIAMDVHERSEGVHVSQVIRSLNQGLFGSKFRSDLDETALESYRMLGFAWERVIVEAVLASKTLLRPGEVRKGTIIGSPDAVNEDDWSLEEWKCTWRSLSNLIGKGHKSLTNEQVNAWIEANADQVVQNMEREFFEWVVQQRTYCHMLSMDSSILRIMFVNGDYAANRRPFPVAVRLTFTPSELKDNWTMITDHAREKGWLK